MGQFNWIDIVSLIILIRIGYVSFQSGLYAELFKFWATVVSLIIGLHFYKRIGSFIESHLFLPEWLSQEMAMMGVFFLFFLIFFLLRISLLKIMSTKFTPQVDRAGAVVLGIIRAIFTVSLILLMLNLLPSKYVQKSLWKYSLTGPLTIKMAPETYKYLIRFVPNSRANEILT